MLGYSIAFKDETWWMHLLSGFVGLYCPGFMTSYITVIGKTIYFPSLSWLMADEDRSINALLHECVHLSDIQERGVIIFSLGYLFPQILALGALLTPWLGWWALGSLFFLLPLPAPFRAHWEARAYALDYILAHPATQKRQLDWSVKQFSGMGYYRMAPDEAQTRERILFWVGEIESGREPMLTRLLLDYEFFSEQ